jgi:hypothetical protein
MQFFHEMEELQCISHKHRAVLVPLATAAGDRTIAADCRCDALQYSGVMKTAVIAQVRVEPKLRAEVESVLSEGETLSEFVEATVLSAVQFRRMQMEFQARADAAWQRFQRTGEGRPAGEVVAALQSKLDARRRELKGKRRPATT